MAVTAVKVWSLFTTQLSHKENLMQIFEILNSDGDVINRIVADASFVEAQYSEGEYRPKAEETFSDELIAEAIAFRERNWRDSELLATDFIVPVADHPQRAAYMTYRTALRNWPASDDFPATRPTLGS